MNGNKYLLDTNAIIALLGGNKSVEQLLLNAEWIGVSVISVIEFFSFPKLSSNDRHLFTVFLERVEIIGIPKENLAVLEDISIFKVENSLKLPDAIIGVRAIQNQAVLVSNDSGFEKTNKISLLKF
jgi:tRNA(fMet)-specific endonuclease VapC